VGAYGGRRRETYRERRERRATIDDPEVVFNAAGRYLEARSRSVGEVRRYLNARGYRADLVEGVLGRLQRAGFLDDRAFARGWVESRDRAHPRGEQALRRELLLKDVDPALIKEILERRRTDAATVDDFPGADASHSADLEAAERLLARRAAALSRAADQRVRRQRAYALLARNGFGPDICRDAAARFAGDGALSDD
jgi:regulatory protein